MNGGLQVGQLVKSKAGRDKNKLFLIYEVLDETFVRVVDGDYRKIERPKKKNLRHLVPLSLTADSFKDKVNKRESITDAEVRKVIADLAVSLRG